jgi:hypothetical protein
MIAYLGASCQKQPHSVVFDTGGGATRFLPISTYQDRRGKRSSFHLHPSLDSSLSLFGFCSTAGSATSSWLIAISGSGPR